MLSFLHSNLNKSVIELWDIAFKQSNIINYKPYTFNSKEKIEVFLTMTTCKRIDLFQKTVNSILNTWSDLDKVDAWFCVDDNSSEDDRNKMTSLYPWMKFYMKTQNEKGHRKSMNLIWDKLQEIKPIYWIHIEDDFVFHVPRSYVSDAIRGLEMLGVDQLLFNRNYAETIQDYHIKGHVGEGEFCTHKYEIGNFDYKNCHYWPHYSFRPSLIKVSTILSLGNFDSSNTFFEMDYAKKWVNAGYKSGFFNMITCQHIGKLTREKGINAYALNQCDQFSPSSPFIKVVNLERRKDRREHVEKILKNIPHQFIKAVDGSTLHATKEIQSLFEGNDFNSRKGVIGCALSHYYLWKQLLTDTKEYYFIMEDDIEVCDHFSEKLDSMNMSMKNHDICFLGYHMFEKHRDSSYQSEENIIVQPLQNIYIGGFFAYSINKNGAKKMIDYIEKNGIKHGIDYLIKIGPVECMECKPHLVFSEWNENGKLIDTDIQRDYTSLFESNYIFVKGLDHHGNDKFCIKDFKFNENMNEIAVNTLGFVKDNVNVHQLKPTTYFNNTDGIYIHKDYFKTQQLIRVKMLCNWCSSEQLCKEWSNMCEYNFTWQHIQMTWKDDADYFVVINSTHEYHNPSKTMVFQMEPWVYDTTKTWGVKTWGKWAKPKGYLHVNSHDTHLNTVFWQLEQTYQEWIDMNIEKTKELSTICSSKYFDEGHILRIDLLKKLDSQCEIDIYNKFNHLQFKQYKGCVTPYVDKSKGMLPYKYYFMMENNFEHNFITEKLWEPILCESLCFYYGCPNVTDHIDSRAFVLLDKDIHKSIEIIQTAIKEDWYTQRLPFIKKAKMDILYRMSFFPTLNHIIQKSKRPNPFNEKYKQVCFICHIKENGLEPTIDLLLKQNFDKIFIVGESININHPKIQVIQSNIYSYQLEIINLIRTFSENQECNVLYINNTKDVTFIEKIDDCIDKLITYDTVGLNAVMTKRPYYDGNFWWSKTSYLKTLHYLSILSPDEAKLWLFSNHQCKWYSF
jgi:GR25 family glycosyltransferase involved in LPS biosynthesis